ncbi:MAG: hypothetical protein KGL39_48550 [Patescibacteria group bacterium]|nr:hypothetical protein [Patescibacteria group bacterium]
MRSWLCIAVLFLAGCASDQFHAVGTPTKDVQTANVECSKYIHPGHSLFGFLGVFGAVGGAAAGAASSTQMTGKAQYEDCMRLNGWAKN